LIGTTLGHYSITAKLGEGGMGEVWRATDTKLRREVAIKVLPAAFTEDKERLARFEREAQLLAQLHHPHIASIFGIEEGGGTRALVMELVEGPTLAERLEAGPLPLDESLSFARQIAEALEEAHDKGIVHRDLKPQNVKASREGRIKVLDFGLAKAMDPTEAASGSASQLAASPTLTLGATVQGVILGTAAYMAPEQAKGWGVDKRADIWAFGVVLYEMLTGARLFAGDSVPDTLAGVLRAEIDLGELPPGTPPAIRRLLRRCLERKPKDRLHSIADARIVIDEVLRGESDEAPADLPVAAPVARRPAWVAPAALLAVAAVAAAASWVLRKPAPGGVPDLELSLAIPEGYTFALDNYPEITLSADGRRQVIVVFDEEGQSHLMLRDLAIAEPRILPDTDGAVGPALAPNGEAVAFIRDTSLRRVSLAGGPSIQLAELSADYRGACWSRDGFIYFSAATSTAISRVPENGGAVEPVTELDAGRAERTHRWPAAAPDGSFVLFTSDTTETTELYDDARIEAVRPSTRERVVVLEGASRAAFLPPEHLVFGRGGTLFAVRFDPKKLAVLGNPLPLVQQVSTEVASGAVRFAIAESGAAAWVEGKLASQQRALEWIERDGSVTPFEAPEERYSQLRLSPDGRRLLLATVENSSTDLWVQDLESGRRSRLTFGGSPTDAVWSPDGSEVVYAQSAAESGLDLYRKPADGSGEAVLLLSHPGDDYPSSFSPDGRSLLLESHPPDKTNTDVFQLDLESGEAKPVLADSAEELLAEISPDGRWVAYSSDENGGTPSVLVRRFPGMTGKWQVSIEGGTEPHWAPEGDAIYYRYGGTLYRAGVDTRNGFTVDAPVPLATGFTRGSLNNTFTVARGGRVLRARNLEPERRAGSVILALDLASRARRALAPRR